MKKTRKQEPSLTDCRLQATCVRIYDTVCLADNQLGTLNRKESENWRVYEDH